MFPSYERAHRRLSKTCKRVAKQLALLEGRLRVLPTKNDCQAFELDLTVTQSKRYGNLFLDIFGFLRKTRETGWNFKALIVLNRGTVVFKLWSGEPHLERYEKKKKSLGPLQELDSLVRPPSPSL